jgi:hypothetical protein
LNEIDLVPTTANLLADYTSYSSASAQTPNTLQTT